MKKVFLTAFAAMALVAMVACNNKANENAEATEPQTEECQKACAQEGDTAACCKAKVEGAACEGEQKECCKKAEGEKCCKGEGKECPNEAAKAE